MIELRERDAMVCRACGREERASEGYPCADCGRFICNMCNMRGVTLCADCARKAPVKPADGAPQDAPASEVGKAPAPGA
jgi:hypothetical protein